MQDEYSGYFLGYTVIVALVLYLLDADQWDDTTYWTNHQGIAPYKPLGRMRKFFAFTATISFCASVIFSVCPHFEATLLPIIHPCLLSKVDSYPYGPICVFLIFVTTIVIVCK